MRDRLLLKVTEPSQVADARRRVTRLALQLGFDETATGKAALLITELGTNLVKHAGRDRHLMVWGISRQDVNGLEILALDKGPGIYNVQRALEDGYSTSSSSGTGLGSVRRQSDFFDIYSRPGQGTAILSRIWSSGAVPPHIAMPLTVGGVHLAKPGQDVCGDAWHYIAASGRLLLVVADGLGHGQEAARASTTAVQAVHENQQADLALMMKAIHKALNSTRGAAVALVHLHPQREEVRFVGVGNVAGSVWSGGRPRHLISHNGTIGHILHRVQEFTYDWPPKSLLILHTDGIQTRWDLDDYPGLARCHPTLIAGVLYRDFRRGNDDSTVVAVRHDG